MYVNTIFLDFLTGSFFMLKPVETFDPIQNGMKLSFSDGK